MSRHVEERQLFFFNRHDADEDGGLTKEEYLKVFRDRGVNLSEEEAEEFFKDKDKDRDGRISYLEFQGKQTETEKLWRAMGGGGDRTGTITESDAKMAAKKYKKTFPESVADGIVATFKRRKSDDRKLTYEDFCTLMNDLKTSSSSNNVKRERRVTQLPPLKRTKSGLRLQQQQKQELQLMNRQLSELAPVNGKKVLEEEIVVQWRNGSQQQQGNQRTHYSRHF